ncbi:MAG TPA: isoprenylcysteine carboxylmethyltransferase family protein, partial [Candidatus Nitrosotenuis sp.]|nr:isoprenylcysteine carboxylmethyltransferase family protein [Candidatus Nitrosotenuis sp.]
VVVTMALMMRHDPELLRERFHPGPGRKEGVARPLLIVLIFLHWIVAGLDVGRIGWSGEVSPFLQAAGVLVIAAGMFGWTWAMCSNHFFSSEVRIQTERGHHVVRGGPYRFLRHPGYAAGLFLFAADPLVLGSWWSAVPMIGVLAVFVWRAAFEDKVLHDELPGYREYAGEVRYRLLPGIW